MHKAIFKKNKYIGYFCAGVQNVHQNVEMFKNVEEAADGFDPNITFSLLFSIFLWV